MFLKGFLRESIKGERRNSAFQVGCSHAPVAAGAAPAAKVVSVDPDQAFVHTSTLYIRAFGSERESDGWTSDNNRRGGKLLPVATHKLARDVETEK
jgi:hypothetical protein